MDACGETQGLTLLTSADVGKRLGLTPAAVRYAAKRGALHPSVVTPGGQRLFTEADVAAFAQLRSRVA